VRRRAAAFAVYTSLEPYSPVTIMYGRSTAAPHLGKIETTQSL
jgi:hypothetical protein